MFHKKCYLYYGFNNETHEEDRVVCLNIGMSTNVGNNRMKNVETPILIFPNWNLKFHVHINACIFVNGWGNDNLKCYKET
jgi:hypothetical protein